MLLLCAAFALFFPFARDAASQGSARTPESVFKELAAFYDGELQGELDRYDDAHPDLAQGWTRITLKKDMVSDVAEMGDNTGNLAGKITLTANITDLKKEELIPTKMAVTFRFMGSTWYPNQMAFQNIHLGNTAGPYNIVDPPVEPVWEMTAINNVYNRAVQKKLVSP
jgi:hypothetical protein